MISASRKPSEQRVIAVPLGFFFMQSLAILRKSLLERLCEIAILPHPIMGTILSLR